MNSLAFCSYQWHMNVNPPPPPVCYTIGVVPPSRLPLNFCYQFQIFHFVNLLSLDKLHFHCVSTSHMLSLMCYLWVYLKENWLQINALEENNIHLASGNLSRLAWRTFNCHLPGPYWRSCGFLCKTSRGLYYNIILYNCLALKYSYIKFINHFIKWKNLIRILVFSRLYLQNHQKF